MPSGLTGKRGTGFVPDALPGGDGARRDRLGKGHGDGVIGRPGGQGAQLRIGAGRNHQGSAERLDQKAHAHRQIKPVGLAGEGQAQHGQYSSMPLTSVAVHIRPSVVSRAACQSKLACTPCGPAISMRGRGR